MFLFNLFIYFHTWVGALSAKLIFKGVQCTYKQWRTHDFFFKGGVLQLDASSAAAAGGGGGGGTPTLFSFLKKKVVSIFHTQGIYGYPRT